MRSLYNRIAAAIFATVAVTQGTALALDSRSRFVQVRGTHFEIAGAPYRFIGANFWYGMNLGADDATGDRERLKRELDRLKALGVTNLRVLGASEGPDTEPWRVTPSLQPEPGKINKHVLKGLDYLLEQMGKRGMRAVVCLNNFWQWSGGMAQYRQWATGGSIPYPPPATGSDWLTYQNYSAGFYTTPKATALADAILTKIVKKHASDPTIMSWELANEPRGGTNPPALNAWIDRTADLIKKLDHSHLVTTGSEGDTVTPLVAGNDISYNHASPNIDYVTIHIWAQNWGWYDPKDPATLEPAIAKMKEYLHSQVDKARALAKPLVIEEFGLARDQASFAADAATTARDRYYRELFQAAYDSMASGSPVAGANFWAWSGEGRPREPGGYWRRGDALLGDPPHEAQGWYGIYSTDASTLKIIGEFADRFGK